MGKIAFVFPGQGSQKAGMGRSFYDNSDAAREVFRTASDILGFSMQDLCFKENDRLDLTEYTQAALVTVGSSILAEFAARGIHPDIASGLSLGEYEALIAVRAMEFEDAVKVVRERGILMQEAVPPGEGVMEALLGSDPDTVEAVLEQYRGERAGHPCCVVIANDNCPGQVVISGRTEDVDNVIPLLTAAGVRRCTRLNVSGPFHSPMFCEAEKELEKVLEPVTIHPHLAPYVTTVTAQPVTGTDEVKGLLRRQISHPVLWRQSVLRMIADGVDTFVEIGPGTTVSSFIKRIDRTVKTLHVETFEDMDDVCTRLSEAKSSV